MTQLPLIVSAGEALVDLVRTGEHTWSSHAGGAGWNVARAAAALGLPSAFAGAVGQDVFGDAVTRETRVSGLDERFFQRVGRPTLLAVVHETNPPAYFFLGENSADLAFDPDLLPRGWQEAARWLHLGGISLTRAPLNVTLLGVARNAKAAGVRISFDPNARVVHADPAYRPVMEEVLRLADFVKFSDEDLRFFFPGQSEEDVMTFVRTLTSAPVAVTRGGEGATLYHGDQREDFTALQVTVVDTVGAGDAFVAGALYSSVTNEGGSWAGHVRFALRVAAGACTRPGAHAPTLAEVEVL